MVGVITVTIRHADLIAIGFILLRSFPLRYRSASVLKASFTYGWCYRNNCLEDKKM